MNAVASLAATKPGAWAFVEELWRTPVPTGKYRQVPNRPPLPTLRSDSFRLVRAELLILCC